jgi:hypothetical protein
VGQGLLRTPTAKAGKTLMPIILPLDACVVIEVIEAKPETRRIHENRLMNLYFPITLIVMPLNILPMGIET